MAYFQRLIFCCVLLVSSLAHASFPVDTPQMRCDKTGLGSNGITQAVEVATFEQFKKNACPDSRYVCTDATEYGETSCLIQLKAIVTVPGDQIILYPVWKVFVYPPVPLCPANSTKSGNLCTCNSGFKDNPAGNACIVMTDADEERAICKGNEIYWNSTMSWGDSRRVVLDGQQNTGKITCNPVPGMPPGRGCTAEFQLEESTKNNDGKTWTSWGTAKWDEDVTLPCSLVPNSDGTSNDPPITEIREKPCPFGQPGQINGVDVCVPMKDESKTESRKVTQDEKILPDGSKEVTTTTTTTNCKDRMCMTVTDKKVSSTPGMVTNPPPGGGGPEVPPGGKKLPDGSVWSPTGPTTTTGAGSLGGATPPAGAASGAGSNTGSAGVVTESKSDFCTKNPKDKQCGQQGDGQGGFGGACGAGFKCDGDAVQCAMALEQHKMNCKLYEPDNESDSLFNKARGDRDGYSKAELDAKATQVSVTTFNSNGLGWARSCPANPVIPLSFARGSNSFEIPFSRICGPLSILALAGVGITLLGSMLWVLGGKK